MRRSPTRDLIVGLFVLAGLAGVAYLSLSIGGVSYSGPKGFLLYANFDETGGLKTRAPVVIWTSTQCALPPRPIETTSLRITKRCGPCSST